MEHLFYDKDIYAIRYPRFLFRYARDDDNLIEAIRNPYLWFAAPDTFNDPFECQNILDTTNTPSELAWFLEHNLRKYDLDLDFTSTAKKAFEQPEIRRDVTCSIYNLMLSRIGLCCCTTIKDHPLMWSHYANGHRGVCLVLNTTALLSKGLFAAVQVTYSNKKPRFNLIRERKKYGTSALFNWRYDQRVYGTKTTVWAYEKEVRLISHARGKNPIPTDALNGIIFGAKMAPEFRERLTAELSDRRNIRIANASLDTANATVLVDDFENSEIEQRVSYWQHLPR